MRNYHKALLAGLCVALVLAVAVSSAAGTRIRVSPRKFKIQWAALVMGAAGQQIACPLTIRGSFHSTTISKVARALLGHITEAQVNGLCSGGSATVLTETLPWHFQYNGFRGTLPRISADIFRMVGGRFRVDPTGSAPACLATTTQESPLIGIANIEPGGTVTSFRADETTTIPLGGGFLCEIAGSATLSGEATIEGADEEAGVRLTIRLI